MPPEMITWVTPMAMMPTIDTCRMMIDSRAVLKIEVGVVAGVEQEGVADQQPAERLEDGDDQRSSAEEDVELGRPVPLRGVEGQPADAMRDVCAMSGSPVATCRAGPPSRCGRAAGATRRPGRRRAGQFFARKSPMLAGVTSWNGM